MGNTNQEIQHLGAGKDQNNSPFLNITLKFKEHFSHQIKITVNNQFYF